MVEAVDIGDPDALEGRPMPEMIGNAANAQWKTLVYKLGPHCWGRIIESDEIEELLDEMDAEIDEYELTTDDFAIVSTDEADRLEQQTRGFLMAYREHLQANRRLSRSECLGQMLEVLHEHPGYEASNPPHVFTALHVLKQHGFVAAIDLDD